MGLELSILYRGLLASCNYGCWYCPFAKQVDSPQELATDREALDRFVRWVQASPHRISVLFTPWGEALVRPWYRRAMQVLSHSPNVDRVAIQTNLACSLGWLAECNRNTLALWCTFHPSQTHLDHFLQRCETLDKLDIRYSVGSVGIVEEIPILERLRARLSPDVYLWVNAYKREPDYYSTSGIRRLEAIDPLFRLNRRYRSAGRSCRTGQTVISVYHDGAVRRCHFIPDVLGNIYESDMTEILRPRPCTADTCGCHIGYVHLNDLGLHDVFAGGVLERIPSKLFWHGPLARERILQAVEGTLSRENDGRVPLTIEGRPIPNEVSISGHRKPAISPR